MRLYVTVKSLGKRKPVLERKELLLGRTPATVKELIEEVVLQQVQGLVDRQGRGEVLPFLTGAEIGEQGENGKVGFGTVYNGEPPVAAEAVAAALLAFEDGLYKVFLQERECALLEEPLQIGEGDELVFIRFTMLAGRLW
ncbi:hypothetical protein HQN87_19735 [Paenibacillus tritici]|uniref:DUF3846 domain-containing protein n=1 Tax=Paenibacillus tritici TaxID=1873425 RepID=A0ABX2DVW6_9BACL|nr:hypothetical protein [Paenibacillus tritici]NQX47571.1 hypothetical protein [Paenibacillus tritici]QUL55779.1 hypothetical protein KDC22_04290 [Paenibacillus tritici]